MKIKTLIIFSFLIFLFLPIISHSQDICFSQDDGKKLVMELERGRLIEQNLILIEEQNKELMKQTEILKEQNKIYQEQFQAAYELIKKNEELYKLKTDALENDLKEAQKPRWGSLFGTYGLGAASAFLLLLLL